MGGGQDPGDAEPAGGDRRRSRGGAVRIAGRPDRDRPILTVAGAPPKRRRNLRGEGARLRGEVIEAAMRILDRSPAGELSLRTVAREAGVAGPSLYRQFDDATAMMRAIVQECWRQLGEAMAVAADPDALSPLHCLQAEMGAHVRYAMQRPSRYQLLFAMRFPWEAEPNGPIRPAYRVVLDTIARHAAQGGHLPTEDRDSAALLAISLAHGRIALAHLAPARPGNRPEPVEAFVRAMIARLFGGAQVGERDRCAAGARPASDEPGRPGPPDPKPEGGSR